MSGGRMTIRVYIPAIVAIKAKTVVFGESSMQPTDTQLGDLNHLQAEVLADVLENDKVLKIEQPSATWQSVKDALSIMAGIK